MLRRGLVIGIVCLSFALWLRAHTVYSTKITWSRDVSRIVYGHCASCHHPGGSAFSLMTYQEARPWAEAIKQQVLQRSMPPWNAVKGFGEFKDDRGLTQEDLEIIGEWVDGGGPEGNASYTPPSPDFNSNPAEAHARERRLPVAGTKVMPRGVEAIAIAPETVPSTGELQAIAQLPDGQIEPLVWIEKFNPGFNTTYYFRQPLHFPAGTKIEVVPNTGSVELVVKERGAAAQSRVRKLRTSQALSAKSQ